MLYSISSLAEFLGISRQWLTKQIKRGLIRGEKLSANAYAVTHEEAVRVKKFLKKHGGKFPRKERQSKAH